MEQRCCQNQWISANYPMKYAHCKLSSAVLPAEGYFSDLCAIQIMYPPCARKNARAQQKI